MRGHWLWEKISGVKMTEALARYEKGMLSERIAAFFLIAKGYRIRERRYKTRHGEIDLIATKGKTIAFVEVKSRRSYAEGVEAISPKSQRRIQAAAEHYMQRHGSGKTALSDYVWRFDAVVVRTGRLPYHLKDAWRS